MVKLPQRPWRWLWARLRALEARTLVAIMLIAAGLLAFLRLGDAVRAGRTLDLDRRIILALRDPANPGQPRGSFWTRNILHDLTALGGVGVLTLTVAVAVIFLWVNRRRRHAAVLLGTVTVATVIGEMIKSAYNRSRPDLVAYGDYFSESSFPSGHSNIATVVWMTLALIVASLERTRIGKATAFVAGGFISLTAGASRVYFAVHWPSDVVGGWILGSGWALMAWIVLGAWTKDPAREKR
jgi:undecaprenyl-diphosphatase